MNPIKENTFAAACYEQNSIGELTSAITAKRADKTDCKNWGITPTQWREQIQLALDAKLADKNDHESD